VIVYGDGDRKSHLREGGDKMAGFFWGSVAEKTQVREYRVC